MSGPTEEAGGGGVVVADASKEGDRGLNISVWTRYWGAEGGPAGVWRVEDASILFSEVVVIIVLLGDFDPVEDVRLSCSVG